MHAVQTRFSLLTMFTKGDLLLITGLFLINIVSFGFLFNSYRTPAANLIVTVDGVQTHSLPLSKNATFTVNGEISPVTIEIFDNKARIISSGCKQHICVRNGAIGKVGATNVCLPNKLVIRITGKAKTLDVITG